MRLSGSFTVIEFLDIVFNVACFRLSIILFFDYLCFLVRFVKFLIVLRMNVDINNELQSYIKFILSFKISFKAHFFIRIKQSRLLSHKICTILPQIAGKRTEAKYGAESCKFYGRIGGFALFL